MLLTLRIKNLVLVDDLEIELAPGMNVLTGETGAGKSIILKGLALLAGEKASSDLLRRGAERCEVEGLFIVSPDSRAEILEECPWAEEIFTEESEIIVRRTIDLTSRSKISLNGRLTTRGELEHLAPFLFDVTGQHESQQLLNPNEHRNFLDTFGVSAELREEVRAAYLEWSKAARMLREFKDQSATKADYFRRVALEADELTKANIVSGERASLEEELRRLGSLEFLSATVERVLEGLENDETGLLRQTNLVTSLLEQGLKRDLNLRPTFELVENARISLNEARLSLSEYGVTLNAAPERIEEVRERLSELARLERKYGKGESELASYLQTIAEELSAWQDGDFDEKKLQARVNESEKLLRTLESQLTEQRRELGERLGSLVIRELASLQMEKARFVVAVTPTASSEHGADGVEFLFSGNPGEDPRPLRRVASGGELSRVQLILKTLLNDQRSSTLQVFDEIDSGIGGAVAQSVGEKIRGLTPRYQVLLVTHAPQIAALGDRHFFISKKSRGDQTTTSLTLLDEKTRVKEIARMLAGKTISENFEGSARELLAARENPPRPAKRARRGSVSAE